MNVERQPMANGGEAPSVPGIPGGRSFWRRWSPWVYLVGFITAFVTIWVSFGEQVHDVGVPSDFWDTVRIPGNIAVYFANFFGFAVMISLLAHAILSYESQVRWLAFMGALFTLIYLMSLSFSGVGLIHTNVYILEAVALAVYLMIFSFIAMVGGTGPKWLIMQVIIFLIYVIILGATSEAFRTVGGDFVALLGPPWQQALFYVYWSLGGILRFCALVECKNRRATTLLEELSYWVLIVLHIGLYFAQFALKPILFSGEKNALDNAQLLNQMGALTLYALTPLLLVHFEALSRARARNLIQTAERANKQLAVAQSAAAARREFIRYVFHEVRVPFNTIVLGLDELKACALEIGNKSMVSDIKLMQTAANGMQQILNDTLTIEKMEAGTYLLELQPTHLSDVGHTVVHSMQPWARDKQISLTADVSSDLPHWVMADPNRLSQVLANFLSNALKFVDQTGHGSIAMRMFPINAAVLEAKNEGETTTEIPPQRPAAPIPPAGAGSVGAVDETVAVTVAEPITSASVEGQSPPAAAHAPAPHVEPPAATGFGGRVVAALAALHLTKLPTNMQQEAAAIPVIQPLALSPVETDPDLVLRPGTVPTPPAVIPSPPKVSTATVALGPLPVPPAIITQPLAARVYPSPSPAASVVPVPSPSGLRDDVTPLPTPHHTPGVGSSPVATPMQVSTPLPALYHSQIVGGPIPAPIQPPMPAPMPSSSPALQARTPLHVSFTPAPRRRSKPQSPGSTAWVRIEVADNGVGIAPGQLTKLWQPFSQIEAGIRQQGKGSGLGLHICKEIIRHHGGRVGVRSKPGLGSTFFADIPFQVCHAPSSDGLVSESGASSVAATHLTPARTVSTGDGPRPSGPRPSVTDHLVILVVDDVASNRLFLIRALKRQLPKSEVYEAEDGSQAVRLVTADLSKYHVVCMDKEMPVMDGYKATRELRRAGYTGVIIGVTANALSSDVQDYIAQGVNGVVTKPVDVPGLLDVIEQHISLPSSSTSAAAALPTAAVASGSRRGSAHSWGSDHRSIDAHVSPLS